VLATLNILSVDLSTRTIVISRNSHCPVLVLEEGEFRLLDEPSERIGVRSRVRPVMAELPLRPGTVVVVFSDGVWSAGQRYGDGIDLVEVVGQDMHRDMPVQQLADTILEEAVALDRGRPTDDVSVVVLRVVPGEQESDVRRMAVSFPVR